MTSVPLSYNGDVHLLNCVKVTGVTAVLNIIHSQGCVLLVWWFLLDNLDSRFKRKIGGDFIIFLQSWGPYKTIYNNILI